MTVEPLSERMLNNKRHWQQVGSEILQHYGCEETYRGIGRCIDSWKKQADSEVTKYKETEVLDGLGFLLGDLCILEFGGGWVWITDEHGATPAICHPGAETVSYIVDSISRRLRDESCAEDEIPTIVAMYERSQFSQLNQLKAILLKSNRSSCTKEQPSCSLTFSLLMIFPTESVWPENTGS